MILGVEVFRGCDNSGFVCDSVVFWESGGVGIDGGGEEWWWWGVVVVRSGGGDCDKL